MDTTRQDSGTLRLLRQKMEDYQREVVRKNQKIEELTERNNFLDYQLDQIRDIIRDREMRELEGINVKEGELKVALKLDEMNDKYMKTIQYSTRLYYQDQIKN